jgi:hypothetical protein
MHVPVSPPPAQAEPAAVHMPRMQQPPLLHAFAAQQIWPVAPHGVPFGVLVRPDPPHDETPTLKTHNEHNEQNANDKMVPKKVLVEIVMERLRPMNELMFAFVREVVGGRQSFANARPKSLSSP